MGEIGLADVSYIHCNGSIAKPALHPGKVVAEAPIPEDSQEGRVILQSALLAATAMEIIRLPGDRDEFNPATCGVSFFAGAAQGLRPLFHAASAIVRQGRASDDPGERDAAARLEETIRDVCLTAIGDWFADFLRANSVFLVNFRELLEEHEGEYVLIGLDEKTAQWGFLAFSHDARELGKKAEELRPARCFIERIVEGVETVPELDFSRPETFGDRPGDSQSQLTDGGTGD